METQSIKTLQEYEIACARFEQIKYATIGIEQDEKMILVRRISEYENTVWDLPEPSKEDFDKIRAEHFIKP